MPPMHADSLKIFYEESKAANEDLHDLLKQYRANTTTVLTLATAAATFFGFEDSPKGGFYVAALAAYAVAALLAASIYWPTTWRVNVAGDVGDALATGPPLTPSKLMYDLATGHQEAYQLNATKIKGRFGRAKRFIALIFMTSAVVILASINSLLIEDEESPEITRIQIVEDQ
jgi:hypothetical protein